MPLSRFTASRFAVFCFLLVILCSILMPASVAAAEDEHGESLGAQLPIWSVIPFMGILLSIALFPLFSPRWWHHHFAKVSAFWGLLLAVPFIIVFRGAAVHEILHVYFLEYFPFIILLWALFTISGGIHVRGTLRGTPRLNLIFLIIGTLIASWVGTTGASMILIRPVLRANEWRRRKVHVIIFFIFLVSNIGGSLTPLGDPPLFLGFLLGVPFFWTLRLIEHMAFISVPLLVLFFVIDWYFYRKEEKPEEITGEPIQVDGLHNILLLLGVVGSVLMSGIWRPGEVTILGIHVPIAAIVRDSAMILLGLISLRTTSEEIHRANGFSWFPIQEVGFLFAGIFMTIIPALSILNAGEEGGFAFIIHSLTSPAYYFWITGSLSSFLDNAPSYLTLLSSCIGGFYPGAPVRESIDMFIANQDVYLKAISVGAVFFGAVTYIGNAPNFMVRSIAEEAGIKMPSFFGFMFKYSLPILIPLFVLVTFVFF